MEFFLRSETKQSMLDSLLLAGVLVEVQNDGEVSFHLETASGYTVSYVGEVRKLTGETQSVVVDGEIFEESVFEAVPGYHANVLGELTVEQQSVLPIIPRPDFPVCEFWS